MDTNANQNVGTPAGGDTGNSAVGNQGAQSSTATQSQGNPAGQAANQNPDPRDTELAKYKAEVKRLNANLVKANRGGRQPGRMQQAQAQGEDFDPSDPAAQYATTIEVAEARLRGGLEERFALYPEVEAAEINRIRQNPWAYVSRQTFLTADYETAMDEIEQRLLEMADEKGSQTPANNQVPNQQQTPAMVNANNTQDYQPQGDPGSIEDEDPWTMPLEKLEKKKNKEVAKLTSRP